jgi:hypothetical protein
MLLTGIAAAAPAAAQQSAPADPPPATQPVAEEPQKPSPAQPAGPLFHFEELELDAGFDAEWQRRKTITDTRGPLLLPSRDRQSNAARRFEETIGLRGVGNVVNERVMHYEFDVRGGLSQESFRESRPGRDLRENPHGELFQYDARATLFPAGGISANLLALKQDDRLPRMFLPSLERQRERYRAELVYGDRVLPMRLAFESAYEELLSFNRTLDDDERRGERRVEYEATWQPTEHHQLRFDYEYDDRRETYSGADARFDTTRNYFTLNHALQFGDEHKSRLDTVARFQDETGDLARDVYEFAPQLRLQHTAALSSNYRLQYLQESYAGNSLEVLRGDTGLNYRFDEGIDAGLNFYGLTENIERSGDANEWGAIATAAASRENSLGRLSANLTYTHAAERSDSGGGDGVVVAEAVTLRDPLPTYLAHSDVRRFSIIVTDAERRRTFLVGRDYSVVQVGGYTWLVRLPTGRIADGQTVLVSYLYRTAQDLRLTRDRLDVRVQQSFTAGWTPYYATSLQEEDLDGGRFLSYRARDINRHRVGLDYRQKRWFAGAELEYNDDAIDPYKALHLRADATLLEKAPHSLGGRGNFSFLRFDGSGALEPHETALLDLGISYRFLLEPRLEGSASAAYRYEDDSLFGITHGVDLTAALNWKIGLFTASVEAEYDLLDLPGSRDGTFALWIKLRREFPLLPRRPQ